MKKRVVFFGTSEFSVPFLEALRHDGRFDVVLVVCQPDKKVGRKQFLQEPPVKQCAKRLQMPLYQPTRLDDTAIKAIQAAKPDVGVLVAYGKLLPTRLLELFEHGIVNVHPSLLPMHRGPSPLQGALLAGDARTGVSIMLIDAEMDHGPILAQETIAIEPHETLSSLQKKAVGVGAPLLLKTLNVYLSGGLKPKPQQHERATYTKIISREDGELKPAYTAQQMVRMIAAFEGWPGTFIMRNGKRIKVLHARAHDPSTSREGKFLIPCADGQLEILELQPDGKRPMTAAEFLRGHRAC